MRKKPLDESRDNGKKRTGKTTRPGWVPAVLRWFDRNRRAMPWRDRPTPYRVWISEIMLQQTQVVTATPYFKRFVARFPSVRALADADQQSVLKAWEGLGYYARARNMHRAAKIIVNEHGGRLPRDAKGLRTLPGIGAYSAAAIASICFSEVVPSVDSNVVRLLARLLAILDDCTKAPARRRIAETLSTHMSRARPGDFNQAMMELGALVCRPGNPECAVCPLKRWCAAYEQGLTGELPVLPPRKRTPHYDIAAGVIRRDGKVLIARRKADSMLGGLWEFPGGKVKPGESLKQTARREILEETGLEIRAGKKLAAVDHAYSHFSITLHTFECAVVRGRAKPLASDEVRWVSASRLQDFPFPSANRRIVDILVENGD